MNPQHGGSLCTITRPDGGPSTVIYMTSVSKVNPGENSCHLAKLVWLPNYSTKFDGQSLLCLPPPHPHPRLPISLPLSARWSLSLSWPVLMCNFWRLCLDDCNFMPLGSSTEAPGFSTVSDTVSAHLSFTSGQICAVLRPKAFWRNSLIPIYTSAAKLFLFPTRKTGPVGEATEGITAQMKDSALGTHCSGPGS